MREITGFISPTTYIVYYMSIYEVVEVGHWYFRSKGAQGIKYSAIASPIGWTKRMGQRTSQLTDVSVHPCAAASEEFTGIAIVRGPCLGDYCTLAVSVCERCCFYNHFQPECVDLNPPRSPIAFSFIRKDWRRSRISGEDVFVVVYSVFSVSPWADHLGP